jgi:penicillin G amidase
LKIVKLLLTAITALLVVLFFNGSVSVPGVPLPAMAKFLHPTKGIWNNGEGSVYKNEEINGAGLKAKGDVIYDERMVPHIFADNVKDALFMQGYVEAQNRLFQMDFMTRAASGRLSEVMGPITLSIDKERLRSQIDTAASNAVLSWQKTGELEYIKSFVDGVNHYISNLKPEDYPYEFKLLGYSPELWTIKKSALVYKSMADQLAGKSYDMEYTNAKNILGKQLFDALYPENEDGGYPVIGLEKQYTFKNKNIQAQDSAINKLYPNVFFENRNPTIGSNNWALSASKTNDKSTILCNDPHLGLSLPSIWIEEHISTPTFNAYGVSFPGFPGIMIGYNDNIAWGETNVGQDIEDVFEIKWVDNQRNVYWLDGQKVKAEKVIKPIKIKGLEAVNDTLIYTRFGIVKSISQDTKSDLAVRWLAVDQQKEPEFMTFIDLMQGKNYADYTKAISIFNTPAQNFLFASKTGDIALTVNGKFPIRQFEDGRFIESGSKSAHDWDSYIPREEIPQIFNPKSGYVASSNQRSAGKNYPYYYTGHFSHERNRVINDTLSSRSNFTIDDMKKLQSNNNSLIAKNIVPILIKHLETKKNSTSVLNKLKTWNFAYDRNKLEPTIFEYFYSEFYQAALDEVTELKGKIDMPKVEDWRLAELMSKDPKNIIFDIKNTPAKETLSEVFDLAISKLESEKDLTKFTTPWGQHRKVDIYHYTRVPAFSAMDIVTDGTRESINAMQKNFGPSWRMVIKFGSKTEAYGVFPGGQSGNPLSPFYKNNLEKWANNEYYVLNSSSKKEDHKAIKKISFN